MNIYELECGYIRHFVAATSEEDAYAKGTDVTLYPDIHYLPFSIKLIEVPGYDIQVSKQEAAPVSVEDMNRDQLKQWLKDKGIEFTPQWGEDKLRELALQNV